MYFVQKVQDKADSLNKKIVHSSLIAAQSFGSCYIHQHLSSNNNLHNVLCSYRHVSYEENYRPCNINKQRKVPKIPRVILSNEKFGQQHMYKKVRRNYLAENDNLKDNFKEENINNYNYKSNYRNYNSNFKDNKKEISFSWRNDIKADFSNFLEHYQKSIRIINKLELYSAIRKNRVRKTGVHYIDDLKNSISKNLTKHGDANINKRLEKDIYVHQNNTENNTSKFSISIPKLDGFMNHNFLDEDVEDVEDDEQEIEEDYEWDDESLSEMYRKSIKDLQPFNNAQQTPIVNNKSFSNTVDNNNYNENNEIMYSKRTSADISTIRDYVYPSKENNTLSNKYDLMEYPTADRSISEYIESQRQYSSPIQQKLSFISNKSVLLSLNDDKSLKMKQNSLKKWNNVELVKKTTDNDNLMISLNKPFLRDNITNIKSPCSTQSNSSSFSNNKLNDNRNIDEELHKTNYQYNHQTKYDNTSEKQMLSLSNYDAVNHSLATSTGMKQNLINKVDQYSISPKSNHSNNNKIIFKKNVHQIDTPSSSLSNSGQLQHQNKNDNFILSKNNISEFDSLSSLSSNLSNNDELIDNDVIASDKRNIKKESSKVDMNIDNDLLEMNYKNDENSLSSLSTLKNDNISNTSKKDPSSSMKEATDVSLSQLSNKKVITLKTNFSKLQDQHQFPLPTEMMNEEPKTVNSTSSLSNLSSSSKISTIKNDENLAIHQTSQNSGNLKLISNLDIIGKNEEEVDNTDVIENLDSKDERIVTSGKYLSNTSSLINEQNNIFSEKFNKSENNKLIEMNENSISSKLDSISNWLNSNESQNLNNNSTFTDISSIEDSKNETNKNVSTSSPVKKDTSILSISSLLSSNKKNSELGDINNTLSSSSSSSLIVSSNSLSKSTSNNNETSKKNSKKSSIISSISEALSNAISSASSLSSLPSSAASFQ
uniref:SH2 domain-containing protein n=1 Tax=Parastrongyloides trichosuri TaxID=131310 RepID=A0A0N4Z9K9_PARTI